MPRKKTSGKNTSAKSKTASMRTLTQMTPEEKEAYYAQKRAEIALEKQQEALKAQQAELDAAYDNNPIAEATASNRPVSKDTEEAQRDWQELTRIAKLSFPEGSRYYGLSPKNKNVAIAHSLGWPVKKISAAVSLAETTIYKWLQRPDMKLFIDEFNIKQGRKDLMDKFKDLEYKATCFIEDLLNERSDEDSTKRLKLDAAKWVFDRSRGKASQPIEHRGDNIREILSALKETEDAVLTPEEEEEIFKEELH